VSANENNGGGLIDCHGSSKALRLLQTLNKTPSGKVLYQQIERILLEADHTQDKIIRGYTALVLTMIEAYRRKLPKDSLLYLELKLIQKRLIPPISISELATLQSYIKNASQLINELSKVDDIVIEDALGPLLGKEIQGQTLSTLLDDVDQHESSQSSKSLNQTEHQQKIDQQHRQLQEMQEQLTDKINSASGQFHQFTKKLKTVYVDLKSSSKESDIRKLQHSTMHEIKTFLKQQNNLSSILNETRQLLHKVNHHSQKLTHELNQVRVLSLTDDLTHLPNRRAFVRRLEDEINRSQREASPLILALLDLDFFKDINDRYGHSVGDEILQSYAADILSIFRHYDMVARYGGEEFAIILPNTDYEGATQAFEKVRNKASGHYLEYNNTRIVLPTFSAGLARHRPGESSKDFIERVDALLYKAKQNGRNRIEVEKILIKEKSSEIDRIEE